MTTDIRAEIEAWCASYVTAFNAYDAEAVGAHWTFPALILQAGRSLSFDSPATFTRNTAMLLGFYQRQGVARVVRRVTGAFEMNAEAVAMTVADEMQDESGAVIVGWEAAYVLQRIGGKWQAAVASADGETAAWAARGTPLGSR